MAKTLLQGVNETLKRRGIIQTDLASLTDDSIQRDVDNMVSLWNETVHELYRVSQDSFPIERDNFSITLVAGTREYDLPPDGLQSSKAALLQIQWPGIDETEGHVIFRYPGGIEGMRKDQLIPSQWTGLPNAAAINPTTNKLRLDREATSEEAGRVYVFQYDKEIILSSASDTFPFGDTIFFALAPVVSDSFGLERNNRPLSILFPGGFARAAYLLAREKRSKSYL